MDRFDIYEGYKYELPNFDISVLYLQTPFQATTFVRPICLESPTHEESSDAAIVLGWGKDENGDHGKELKIATLKILAPDYCESALETVDGFGDDLFCAVDQAGGESGSCYGDSGGPIFTFDSTQFRYQLKGLVNGGKRCGQFGSPDIYTSTTYDQIFSWISSKIDHLEVVEGKCSDDQHCVSQEACPHVKDLFAVMQNVSNVVGLRNKASEEINCLVCDPGRNMFCCSKEESGEDDESYLPHHQSEDEGCEEKFSTSRLRSLFCKNK